MNEQNPLVTEDQFEVEMLKLQSTLDRLNGYKKADTLSAVERSLLDVHLSTIVIVTSMMENFAKLTTQHGRQTEQMEQMVNVVTQLTRVVQGITGVDIQPDASETHKDDL